MAVPWLPDVKAWPALVRAAPALVLAASAYGPIVGNGFRVDDFVQLYRLRTVPLVEFLFTPYGGHILLVQNSMLATMDPWFGPQPAPLFFAMLVLHLIAVLLLFVLVERWTASGMLACAAAAWWGTLPVLNGTLGWYSVLGHVVTTIVTLAILVSAAATPAQGPGLLRRAAWIALAAFAALSFDVGLGVALAVPLALWWVVPRAQSSRWPPCALLLLIVPIMYWAAQACFGDQDASVLQDARDWLAAGPRMPVVEPTATELVATSIHVGAALGAVGITQLLGGAWWQVPLLGPPQWLMATAFVVLVGAVMITAPPRWRRRTLALLTLLLASYGSVAVGRSLLIPPLSVTYVATLPRYHYLPTALLAVLSALMAQRLGGALRGRIGWARAGLVAWLLAIGTFVVHRPPAIYNHAVAQHALTDALAEIRRQIAATPPDTPVYIENRRFAGIAPFTRAEVFPGWAALYAIFESERSPNGPRRVFFLDKDPAVRANANRSPYTAGLIIAEKPSAPVDGE